MTFKRHSHPFILPFGRRAQKSLRRPTSDILGIKRRNIRHGSAGAGFIMFAQVGKISLLSRLVLTAILNALMNANHPDLFSVKPTVHVGVTGHRHLPQEEWGRIEKQVREVLDEIKQTANLIYQEHINFFSHYHADGCPQFRLISALAEGADRLVAHQALELGYALQCPLPFSRTFYESTFEADDAEHREFRELLGRADAVFEVAAGNTRFTSQAYADIADVLISHSDFLVALWDGQPGRSIAGTYATIKAARQRHIPVIIISTEAGNKDSHDAPAVVYRGEKGTEKDWSFAVKRRLKQILLPLADGNNPLFPVSGVAKPHHGGEWQKMFEKILLIHTPSTVPTQCVADEATAQPLPAASPWSQRKGVFSALVADIGKHYRNSLLGRQFFPLLATVFLTFALNCSYLPFLPWFKTVTGIEEIYVKMLLYGLQILSILFSLYLVLRDRTAQYHRKFFNYRVLAELCRQTTYFFPMGFCHARYHRRAYQKNDGDNETAWYYRMLLRSEGLPHATISHDDLKQWLQWLKESFVQPQWNYHAKRASRCGYLQNRLAIIALLFFMAGLLFTLGRTVLDIIPAQASSPELTAWFASLALICPPAAVFFASFSNNSGYPVHYGISRHMLSFFDALKTDISTLEAETEREVSFSEVLRICQTIDDYCRDELSDWEDTLHSRAMKWV